MRVINCCIRSTINYSTVHKFHNSHLIMSCQKNSIAVASISTRSTRSSFSSNSSRSCNRIPRNTSSNNIRDKYLYKLGFKASSAKVPKTLSRVPTTINRKANRSSYTYRSCINDRSEEKVSTIPNVQTTMPRDIRNKDVSSEEKEARNNKVPPNSPNCVGSAPIESILQSPTQNDGTSIKKKERNVSFDETVLVLTIPSKDAYSDRIRKFIWTEPHEMIQNTTRNTIEFASENWDWRQVADDVEFSICPVTGEKIHPCHTSYVPEQISYHRPLNRNPFFAKSRQAAEAWQQQSHYGHGAYYSCNNSYQ